MDGGAQEGPLHRLRGCLANTDTKGVFMCKGSCTVLLDRSIRLSTPIFSPEAERHI